jgi:hypothetical protein
MVFSGFLRVVATMVLAYPEYIAKKNGDPSETSSRRSIYIAIHVGLLAIAAVVSIVGSVHGPVSIAVPVQTGSMLLFNVIAMGLVLKMRTFDKVQRTGTYVTFFSVLSLIDVGPSTQDGQDVVKLLSHPGAMTWSLFVSAGLIMSTMGTIQLLKGERENEEDGNSSRHVSIGGDNSILGSNNSILVVGTTNNNNTTNNSLGEKESFMILLVGATLSNVAMATSGKCLGYLTGFQFSIAFLYYVVAALLGLLFSVTSATACDQGIFTPACSVALVIVNWFTGILIWEDWRVMDTWVGYICACLLMCCGVYLLAEIDLLEQYLVRKTTRMVRLPENEISQGPLAGPWQETIDESRLVSSCEDTNDEYEFLASGSVGSSF